MSFNSTPMIHQLRADFEKLITLVTIDLKIKIWKIMRDFTLVSRAKIPNLFLESYSLHEQFEFRIQPGEHGAFGWLGHIRIRRLERQNPVRQFGWTQGQHECWR